MVPVQEQRSRVLILVNSCVHILYGVSTMILATFAVNLIANETHTDNGIQKNWSQNMIIDIQSNRYETCPAGYEPMFTYDWPGTIPACNCLLWDDNPLKPHGPDGEYSQIPIKQNNKKDLFENEQGTSNSKENKKYRNFVKNKLDKNFQNEQNRLDENTTLEQQLDFNEEKQNSLLKKKLKHENNLSNNKFDYNQFYQSNQPKETKEDIINRLSKYGQENKIYTDGLCNWNQTQAGCLDIPTIKPQQFSKWKQRLQWCVQRAQAVNMVTMYKYYDPEKGECKDENLRVCGDPDDKNFQYCFPKSYPNCPINGILISTTQPRGQEAFYYNSRPMQFSRNQVLYVSRVLPKQLPISNFAVSEDSVCVDGNQNTSENHEDHFLLRNKRKRCVNETDDRYLQIDQQGEISFYFNNFALYLRDTLPHLQFDNSYKFGLFKHNYIQWKHDCSEDMGYFLSDTIFDQFYTREKTLKIITYLVSIITILVAVFEMLLICKIPFVNNIEKHLLQWSPCIQIALSLIVLPFGAAALHQAIVLTNIEYQLQKKQCTDEFTLKLIGSGSVDIHQKVQNFNKGQVIFICLLLLVNGLNFLLTLCCNNSNQGNQKKKRRASTY